MTQPRKRSAAKSGTRPTRAANPDRVNSRPSPARIARAAAEQLTEIAGLEPDSISGLERTENGWLVRVEVVEVSRIPDSTSVMASYTVEVDGNGELQSYRREHRYYRNQAGEV